MQVAPPGNETLTGAARDARAALFELCELCELSELSELSVLSESCTIPCRVTARELRVAAAPHPESPAALRVAANRARSARPRKGPPRARLEP